MNKFATRLTSIGVPLDEDYTTQIIKHNIANILEKSEFTEILALKVHNLDSLIIFNNTINNVVSELLVEQCSLKGKSDKFLDAFRTSSLSKFSGEENEKDLLMDLIEKKKAVYQELLLESIKRGNFNLSKANQEDLVNLVKSGIFEWKDSLYRKYVKAVKAEGEMDLGDKLYYGIPSGKQAGTYKESILDSEISPRMISEINDEKIKGYLKEILTLSMTGNNNYADWITAEKNEVDIWLGDGNLIFIAPMENYIHNNFVDPEFIIHLREKIDIKTEQFEKLSRGHFGDDYGMSGINTYFTEAILKGGNASFSQFLGKSFPNDMELRKDFGTFIAIVKGEFGKTFDEYYKMIAKIFSIDPETLLPLKETIVSGAMEETIYHEYGHSLFGVKSTDIEETKATMFYWLHLFDKYVVLKEELNLVEIKRIMLSFTLDFTRYISRLENSRYRKYVYTSQILLHHMMASGLLNYQSDTNSLKLNIEDEDDTITKFKSLLRNLMNVTGNIKSIYDAEDKERVLNMTNYYNEETLPIITKLYRNFN